MSIDVCKLYEDVKSKIGSEVTLQGWVRNHRKQKEFGFIDFNDGTCFKSVQVVYDNKLSDFEDIQKISVGSAIEVVGTVIESPAQGQEFEVQASKVVVLGTDEE